MFFCVFKVAMVEESVYPFPTVDVPDHAHYTIGAVILTVGITGMLGNFLVIYAFSRWEEQAGSWTRIMKTVCSLSKEAKM